MTREPLQFADTDSTAFKSTPSYAIRSPKPSHSTHPLDYRYSPEFRVASALYRDSTDHLLPPAVTGTVLRLQTNIPWTIRARNRMRIILEIFKDEMQRVCISLAWCIAYILGSATVGLAWSIICTFVGRYILDHVEPYKSVKNLPLLATSTTGGAMLGAGSGLLSWVMVLMMNIGPGSGRGMNPLSAEGSSYDTRSKIILITISTALVAVGFCGQALGVFVLHGRVPGALDIAHAFESNAVGQPIAILGFIAALGSPYAYYSDPCD